MEYIKPENSNFIFTAGNNPATGDLHVTMCFRPDIPGRAFHISEWMLSEEELAEVIRTKKIFVSIMGVGMMPISVMGTNPFQTVGYYPAVVTEIIDENVRGIRL
jgi:hypothetical protein